MRDVNINPSLFYFKETDGKFHQRFPVGDGAAKGSTCVLMILPFLFLNENHHSTQ